MRSRAFLFSLIALALLLSCSASGAREGAASPSAEAGGRKQYREGLVGVDFSGLDEAGKNRALDLMNAHNCNCSCGMTIAQCRVEDPSCGKSPVLARAVIDGVKARKSESEIAASLQPAPAAAAPAAQARPVGPVSISMEGAQVKGNPKAAATLVEFADYQCPYCVRAVPVVQQLMQKYPDDLKFVFKQLPLTSIHRFAEPAARASLAAARQGKFWEMHQRLFDNYRALDDASLKKYAQEIGLDMARFERDLTDPAVAQEVARDAEEARTLGVEGTPTFFLNGVRVPSWDADTLSKMIDAAVDGEDVSAVAGQVRARLEEQQRAAREAQRVQREAIAKQVVDIDVTGAPIKGDPKAPVTIVEFADFQCPYCASSVPLIRQVMDAFPGKVRFAYKHLPLVSIHPHARPAALASLEAAQQGKFWEMHDLLYENYRALDPASLNRYAQQVGLNMAEFEKAMASEEHKQAVEKDMADSQRAGVTGTPAFFVNGKRVMQRDFDTFKRMIEEALASSAAPAAR
ncbi:MAG TPA: thioredoxin domain-containing protein [Candidatus Polarisedimenticolia bacterium]|nr:thioredoxin domain-containing protein [Candidatus Polarisedimenticolia bacterium]